MNLQLKLQKIAIKTYLEATNIVPPKMFRGLEETKKTYLMFWMLKKTMKGKCYDFSCHKERNKVCVVYLECKLQKASYGWWIF